MIHEFVPKIVDPVNGIEWDPMNHETVHITFDWLKKYDTDFQLRAFRKGGGQDAVILVVCNDGDQPELIIHPGEWLFRVNGVWRTFKPAETVLLFRRGNA